MGATRSASCASSWVLSIFDDGTLDGALVAGRDVVVDRGLDDRDSGYLCGLYVRGFDLKENGKLLVAYVGRGLIEGESGVRLRCKGLLDPRDGIRGRGRDIGMVTATFCIVVMLTVRFHGMFRYCSYARLHPAGCW
jgi:hypothetical protein